VQLVDSTNNINAALKVQLREALKADQGGFTIRVLTQAELEAMLSEQTPLGTGSDGLRLITYGE
jgi:hypothetical protein